MQLEEVDAQVALLRDLSRAMRTRATTLNDLEACSRADDLCRDIEAWRKRAPVEAEAVPAL